MNVQPYTKISKSMSLVGTSLVISIYSSVEELVHFKMIFPIMRKRRFFNLLLAQLYFGIVHLYRDVEPSIV